VSFIPDPEIAGESRSLISLINDRADEAYALALTNRERPSPQCAFPSGDGELAFEDVNSSESI
jgi:hypothetical protein